MDESGTPARDSPAATHNILEPAGCNCAPRNHWLFFAPLGPDTDGLDRAGACSDEDSLTPLLRSAFQFLVFTMARWIHRGQQQVIEYLLEGNRVLREQLGGRRLRLTDAQRRRLAVCAKALGRQA